MEKNRKVIIQAAVTIVVALLIVGAVLYQKSGRAASFGEGMNSATCFYFDTVITVTIYESSADNEEELISGCFALADRYEKLFSATRKDSDISRINSAKGETVTVDAKTADIIAESLRYADESGGLFDISIGAASSLWDFHTDDDVSEGTVISLPDDDAVKEAVAHTDHTKIAVDTVNNTVKLSDPDMRLDLGGIAKGYIADEMKAYLVENGVKSAIINLGGNVDVIGVRPDGADFTIGIQKPFAANSDISAKVYASDISVVTSGTYQRYFIYDGRLYHHILDPRTGYPADNGLSSVTVISKSSTKADALSTTVFLMGKKDGFDFAEKNKDIEAIFIDSDGQVTLTSGLKDVVEITD